jgi:hypothetical protein
MNQNAVTAMPINIAMTPQILPSELAIITSCIFIPIILCMYSTYYLLSKTSVWQQNF